MRFATGVVILTMMTATAAQAATSCTMTFSLKGWSAFYKVSHGTGKIKCDNGQRASVELEAKGGGLTFGKSEIKDGIGTFSPVSGISELYGTYVQGGADAGAGKSAASMAMTKGEVSLALTGKGSGFNLGVSFGKFVITKK